MNTKVGPEHLKDFERRRSLRFVLPRQENITLTAGGQQYQCKLEDVSIGGAKLRISGTLPEPVDIVINHESAGMIDGTCMWREGQCVGIAFPLTDPALRLISLCLRQGVPSSGFHAA